ncbi:MAG TPA: ribonuclease J [Vicinamibacterales bacterium]|nr:ribonuclease J [Vicinamibacterales bacterium]
MTGPATLAGSPEPGGPHLEVVPLGGLGEFGMNMTAVSWGETLVLVDAGVMFPDAELLGVDLVIPDLAYLEERRVKASALVLTHGHEDHIGAVPHVLPLVDGPVYGTPLTLAMLEPKLEEHGVDARSRLVPVSPRGRVEVGPLAIEFFRVTHSIPDAIALAIETPVGTIVHTGDFKIDQTPLDGEKFDFHRFAELGAGGVLALLGDSTNIERPGVTGSEYDVVAAFEELFASTRGKLVVTSFATSIYRMQILVNLAKDFGRKVAFVGRGMIEQSQVAQRLGKLHVPPGLLIRETEVRAYPARQVLCLTTGSQGEPMSALSRIAVDDHRHVSIGPDDRVVFSARAIPGNEKPIDRVINHLARRGADVVTDGEKRVHVSGHGSEEELKTMLSLVRPRCFIPIHGEYRQRSRYARLAQRLLGGGTQVLLAENGDLIRLDASGARVTGRVATGRVLIDGPGTGEVADEVLRDRRHLAEDGLIVPVLAINKQTGQVEGVPDVITRGLVLEPDAEGLLREAGFLIADVLDQIGLEERTDRGLVKERIRVELRRFFRKRSGRRPLVLPVIMEI